MTKGSGVHEDEDDVSKVAGQYNVMTIYNVVDSNNLNRNVEQNFEDQIDDEAGFVEFIGMPIGTSMLSFNSVISIICIIV